MHEEKLYFIEVNHHPAGQLRTILKVFSVWFRDFLILINIRNPNVDHLRLMEPSYNGFVGSVWQFCGVDPAFASFSCIADLKLTWSSRITIICLLLKIDPFYNQ